MRFSKFYPEHPILDLIKYKKHSIVSKEKNITWYFRILQSPINSINLVLNRKIQISNLFHDSSVFIDS